jgi:hypothetical protein
MLIIIEKFCPKELPVRQWLTAIAGVSRTISAIADQKKK